MAEGFNELILVFGSYKPNLLKKKTIERDTDKAKLAAAVTVQYKIEDGTNTKHSTYTIIAI